MQVCILVGVSPLLSKLELIDVSQKLEKSVTWVASSQADDEDGKPTQLLCGTTECSVDDIVEETCKALGEKYSCELWASAPAILPLRPSCGYNKLLLHQDSRHMYNTMKKWGMLVLPQLINEEEVKELRSCIKDEITTIETLIQQHNPDIIIGKDIISYQEIASRGNERFDLLLHSESKVNDFVRNVLIDRIRPTLERILNGRVNNGEIDQDISVVYSKPGAPNQGWHADGDFIIGTTDAGWDRNGWKTQLSEPYALCLFIPLIDLDDETGYTQFWPGSHRNRGLAGFGPVAEMTKSTWDGKCRAGDAIWYDYRLMHRGMGNLSKVLRPVLQVLFKKSWYAEKRNYGTDSLREM